MRCDRAALLLVPVFAAACAGSPDRGTLADLREVTPDMREVQVENSLDQAILGYGKFLEEAPESSLTPEAMRRLADLKLEKEFGIIGDGKIAELPVPAATHVKASTVSPGRVPVAEIADHSESEGDFERRAASEIGVTNADHETDIELPGGSQIAPSGPLEAIELYDQILASYPTYEQNDQVLYQKARAYEELGRIDEAIDVIEHLVAQYPKSRHIDEVQFRRAEYFFTRGRYLAAEEGYSAIIDMGVASEYYELALYKLGWAFYKQELHEEALDQYIALLDYKVSTGYEFDQSDDEDQERRIADTYRVISLSFSNLGGPKVVEEYFAEKGHRTYEDRIYSHLGEFYLEKLRYHDAAAAYRAFVALHGLHRASPHFSMRVIEIYEAGGFPKLVLESRKDFAATYGLQSEYWRSFDVHDSPKVLSYLKANLRDLASHYHARYQDPQATNEKPGHFEEALRWYRAYLASFPEDSETPATNYRVADLLLEHHDFGEAAREYERTAYDYPEHAQSAAAGYAAIFAHRENQKVAVGAEQEMARSEAVASTLRFVEVFPKHEHAAAVLSKAADDLYDVKEFERAIATAEQLIQGYPAATLPLRRSAWAVVAHSSFDIEDYGRAENAYGRVLEMTPADDDSRQPFADNLAAAIYKQGERANLAKDYEAAADHFLRIGKAAPTSEIRPLAQYDAGVALIGLEDWPRAAKVLESFQQTFPNHELHSEATKQIAFLYREQGNMARAAREYERVAMEAEAPEVRREGLLIAGDLYEDSENTERALAVYLDYVSEFPKPIEIAVETRFKIAEIYKAELDDSRYYEQLRRIVKMDQAAGDERTARVRFLAAQSARALAESLYHRFADVELNQPFEQNLEEKQRRMDSALAAFERLLQYEVADVTAAATFYMAELYCDFSEALVGSERPSGLDPAELRAYELVLEEEAFPFEERAIEVHEKNLELMTGGIYNVWIEKSLAKLAQLMPGRYAKFEMSSGLITSIGSYAYRAPSGHSIEAGALVSPDSGPEATRDEVQAGEDSGVDTTDPEAPASLDFGPEATRDEVQAGEGIGVDTTDPEAPASQTGSQFEAAPGLDGPTAEAPETHDASAH